MGEDFKFGLIVLCCFLIIAFGVKLIMGKSKQVTI